MKLVKIHFNVVPFSSIPVCKMLQFWVKVTDSDNPLYLEISHPEVNKNPYYVLSPEGIQKEVISSWTIWFTPCFGMVWNGLQLPSRTVLIELTLVGEISAGKFFAHVQHASCTSNCFLVWRFIKTLFGIIPYYISLYPIFSQCFKSEVYFTVWKNL